LSSSEEKKDLARPRKTSKRGTLGVLLSLERKTIRYLILLQKATEKGVVEDEIMVLHGRKRNQRCSEEGGENSKRRLTIELHGRNGKIVLRGRGGSLAAQATASIDRRTEWTWIDREWEKVCNVDPVRCGGAL